MSKYKHNSVSDFKEIDSSVLQVLYTAMLFKDIVFSLDVYSEVLSSKVLIHF